MTRAYDEIIDFIAGGSTSREVAEWSPSDAARERVRALMDAEKKGTLLPDDRAELNHYLELEHLMRLAKARARQCSGDE